MSSIEPPTINTKGLIDDGLGWLIDSTFLAQLSIDERASALASMRWRSFDAGDIIVEYGARGHAAQIIVHGEVLVQIPDDKKSFSPIAAQGPGNVIGERSLYKGERTTAEVRAATPVRTLCLTKEAFDHLSLNSAAFRRYIEGLIELRDRWDFILEILLRNRFLRLLSREDLERMLQSARLESQRPGACIMQPGDTDIDVFVIIGGKVAVRTFGPSSSAIMKGPGELFGHAAVLLNRPRSVHVRAVENTELLRICGPGFFDVVTRNPPVRRRLLQYLEGIDGGTVTPVRQTDRPTFTLIAGSRRGVGATTVAYGLAAALSRKDRAPRPVRIVDLDGPTSAQKLGAKTEMSEIGDLKVHEMACPWNDDLRVLWSADPERSLDLVSHLNSGSEKEPAVSDVLIVGGPDIDNLKPIIKAAESLILVRNARDVTSDLPGARGLSRVNVVRVDPGIPLPLGTNRKTVRLTSDSGVADGFWRSGNLEGLIDETSSLGRTVLRLYRVHRGTSIGVALGGGGALGFAHIGLLGALVEEKIPIDYVSGTSFGSLVAALYAGGGIDAASELIKQRSRLAMHVTAAILKGDAVAAFVDKITGGRYLSETEIPFYPVGLDISTGREFVLAHGTLGQGVVSSSCLPGVFPAMKVGYNRLVDGGVVNNVPASVVWEAGADFIIASNIIPENPLERTSTKGKSRLSKALSSSMSRVDDIMRSLYLLMSQSGRDRALLADYVYNLKLKGFNITQFNRGDEIYRLGKQQAEEEMESIRYMYTHNRDEALDIAAASEIRQSLVPGGPS